MRTLKHSIAALFVFAILFVAMPQRAEAQTTDSCWCIKDIKEIITGDTTLYGSWALDTCNIGIEGNCQELLRGMLSNPSSTVNYEARLYSKTRFEIWIDTILISRSSTTLTTFTWDDIDNRFIEIKQGLEDLENNYGEYSLIPLSSWENDSIGNRQIFGLDFENFVNIAEVLDFLYHINDSLSGNLYLHSKYDWLYTIDYLEENIQKEDIIIMINPNPVNDQLNINFDWNLAGDIELNIFDIQGNILEYKSIKCHFGKNNINIDFKNYLTGVYFLQILYKNEKISEAIFIKK
ncbi:MAG: T9SS type A sorting domain-containing protein [Bacteroidetes bacterium]|nr:MAG: T9SS type A sorting domain-containing protein [Bacteroidota bacterium]